MIGCDLPTADAATFVLLTNPQVLIVNQQSSNTRVLFFDDAGAAWLADAPDQRGWYLAVFNLSDEPRSIEVDLHQSRLPWLCQIRDLWRPLAAFTTAHLVFAPTLPAHGSGLYHVLPV